MLLRDPIAGTSVVAQYRVGQGSCGLRRHRAHTQRVPGGVPFFTRTFASWECEGGFFFWGGGKGVKDSLPLPPLVF